MPGPVDSQVDSMGESIAEQARSSPPGSADFAYIVATLAWCEGLAPNAIVRRLELPHDAKHLMQVKRALIRAQKDFLRLVPPEHRQLRSDLEQLNSKVTFHVVDDRIGLRSGPVFARAAEVISSIIVDVLNNKADEPGRADKDVVICNAGGRSVSETVKALQRNPPVLHEADVRADALRKRLLFVAGNDAYRPDHFDRSANFLSVTMAQTFGARHSVLPRVKNDKDYERQALRIEQAVLFICGAGSCATNEDPGLMTQYFNDHGWTIPQSAVGDLAFNLLDRNGNEVSLPPEAKAFMDEVNPFLNLPRLMHIATNERVVLILDSDNPAIKTKIAVAAMCRGYATDVVLGARLAHAMLQEWRLVHAAH